MVLISRHFNFLLYLILYCLNYLQLLRVSKPFPKTLADLSLCPWLNQSLTRVIGLLRFVGFTSGEQILEKKNWVMLIIVHSIKVSNYHISSTIIRALDKLIHLIFKITLGGRYYYYIHLPDDKI